MNKKALVYIEIISNKIADVSKEIISKLQQYNSEISINGVVLLEENAYNLLEHDLNNLSLNELFVIKDSIFDNFQTCIFADNLSQFIKEHPHDIFLMGATENGRDLAPRIASKLNIGLTADCTQIDIDENANLLATRPTYGGKLMATIISKTKPNFATIRLGTFKNKLTQSQNQKTTFLNYNAQSNDILFEILNCKNKIVPDNWTCADIIVAGGLGLGSKENFQLIYKLAELLNAKPAASRAAIEQGWADINIQVGQTGKSVSPKLYIAFGISGAIQHYVGITNADKIIAINTDKLAPIMQSSDIAIVTDAVTTIKTLIRSLENNSH